MHVTPPMKPIKEICESKLVDASGYVNINKETMQHLKYLNVFGIGDCTTMPGKTAAAIASQSKVLFENLNSLMNGQELSSKVWLNDKIYSLFV